MATTYTEAIDSAPESRELIPEVSEIETGHNGLFGDLDPRDLDEDGEPLFQVWAVTGPDYYWEHPDFRWEEDA
jgi:hypothetical protein